MENRAYMRYLRALAPLLLILTAAPATANAAAPAACPEEALGPEKASFTGTFTEDQEGSYVLVPFRVPDGATRVGVKICYDQPQSPTSSQLKHTLDLGVYQARGADGFFDEDEFRGWGGSSRPSVLITPEQATVGFKPGAIPPGEWAAEIGVAAVAGPLEGDPDGVSWRVEVFTGSDPADTDQPWSPTAYDTTPARTEAGWYKGDFHVHAEHSSPKDASMAETFRYAFKDAGLDFITLSDYVTDRHWDEIGRFQSDYPNNVIMRSAEVITYRGHINNHASATYVDYRTGPIYEWRDGALREVRKAQPASRIFDDIHAGGGFTQVNHPTIFPALVPGFGNLCRGCSWEYSDQETQWDKVDAFEVQTGPSGTSQPHGHEFGPNPFTPLAIQWWDELRAEGHRITAVGSSDSHHAGGGNGTTQSPIGEATTVVYAEELSEHGIQEAVEAGHAYVKFFSPDGPDLRFEARALEGPGNGKGKGRPQAIMGDVLPVGSAHFKATVLGAAPSPEPRTLLVFKDGGVYRSVPVTSNEFTFEFDAAEPGNYRLQLQRGSAFEALTNPITLRPRATVADGLSLLSL
ncbi:MAG: CehA/McbA family metallohydrolase [Actinomycetota bacterium]|nr:CehA/McbA family metallohydrolase [Actinomycetota bacterium]